MTSLTARVAAGLRHTPAPVRHAFTDVPSKGISPLATVMRGSSRERGGGRGGGTRLAVLLTALWVLRRPPHDSDRPARVWAELAALEDPSGGGARAVRDAFATLAQRNLLIHDVVGTRGYIQLLRDDSSGRPYVSPVAPAAGVSTLEPYFRVPSTLWETRLIGALSGRALAMYVIGLRLTRSDAPEAKFWISPGNFKERFGLAESTRKQGLAELVQAGVLTVAQESIDASGGDANRMFRRNVYTIEEQYTSAR